MSFVQSFAGRATFAGALIAAALAFAPQAGAHEFEAGSIHIGHPWSRATPPGARVAAGYATLRNDGAEADRLVGVSAEIAGRAEIHEMAVDAQGVMTMRPLADGVEVPAGGEVELKPGSYHIMFLDLTDAPKEGERFSGSLTFENAGTVEVWFAVEAMGGHSGHGDGNAAHDGQEEDHSGHGGH